MKKVIYSNNGGLGIITGKEEIDFIDKTSVYLHGSELYPNIKTDLDDMFSEPVRYCGLLKDEDHNIMVFHLGSESDFFGT